MNNRKIAFITCVSDERKYAECRYYLDRLHIPEGYNVNVISIQEASSMAAGYNTGMESSDAKYKIYLHQDVFIHNVSFLSDLLAVFDHDEQIGLVGMIGNRERSNDVPCRWDTGKTVDCYGIHDYIVPLRENVFEEVYAADGLLLATQYDIAWREALFDGWHFYDISQCMEFKKAGYKVAVPWQEEAWCCHDTMYPALGAYWKYYQLFVQEYREMNDFPFVEKTADLYMYDMCRAHAYEEAGLWEAIEKLFEMGGRMELREFFSDSVFRKTVNRKEYQLIVYIDRLEEQNRSLLRFWMPDMTAAQLLSKLQELKYMLKRIDCGAVNGQEEIYIQEHYSKYAVIMACNLFGIYKDRIYEKLGEYLTGESDSGRPASKQISERNINIEMCDRREKEMFITAEQDTGKTDIQNAVVEGDYEKAEVLLQNYLKGAGVYDDVIAILDAGIGEHYGDRIRVWKAVQKGLGFNWRNYELYVILGDYYLPENPNQSYLCYENALFYCGDPKDGRVLEQLLYQMREQYEISVNKVAVVILSCGFLEYTKICIDSIRATTSERVREIIVVDNGSRDGSVEWLREQSDIILLENEENRGYPAGCNQGIEVSPVGSDIFLLNNDTVLSENTLFWLRMGLYDREENGTAGCVTNLLRDDQQAEGAATASDLFSFGAQINIPMEYPYENRIFCAGFALLIKRSALEQTGLLDERFGPGKLEDEDYGLRILTAGYQNVLCKNSFLVHFGSVTFQKDGAEEWVIFQRNRQKLNEKWGFKTEYYLGARRDLPGLIEEPREKPLRILEIGCGCGAMMGYIRGVYPNAETFGIELIPEVARIASFMGKVWCCDVEKTEFPWEEEYFDYVIMGDVLEHLMDPEKMLKKLKKHLKTGGHILVSMPNVKCYSVMLPLLQRDEFSYGDSGILDRTHVKMYTGTEIQKLIVRSGYEIEDVTGRIAVSGPNEAEEAVIDVLCSLMEHPDKESFLIFQYLVKAVKQ